MHNLNVPLRPLTSVCGGKFIKLHNMARHCSQCNKNTMHGAKLWRATLGTYEDVRYCCLECGYRRWAHWIEHD